MYSKFFNNSRIFLESHVFCQQIWHRHFATAIYSSFSDPSENGEVVLSSAPARGRMRLYVTDDGVCKSVEIRLIHELAIEDGLLLKTQILRRRYLQGKYWRPISFAIGKDGSQ